MKDVTTAALPSDEAIVDLYWNRDEAAITETDRKYRGYLHTVTWNIVKDEQDCEECLNGQIQECLIDRIYVNLREERREHRHYSSAHIAIKIII